MALRENQSNHQIPENIIFKTSLILFPRLCNATVSHFSCLQIRKGLAELLCKDAMIYQASSNQMSGMVQKMPQTGNTRFYPGSPDRFGRGLDLEKYVKGEEKFFRPAGVVYINGDSSKMKQVFDGGQNVTFEEIVEMMMKADVERC